MIQTNVAADIRRRRVQDRQRHSAAFFVFGRKWQNTKIHPHLDLARLSDGCRAHNKRNPAELEPEFKPTVRRTVDQIAIQIHRHATIGSIGKIKKVSRYFTSYICHSGMLA